MLRSLIAAMLALVALASTAEARARHRAPALHPLCNVTMPCQPVLIFSPSIEAAKINKPRVDRREAHRRARGLQIEHQMPFGTAVRPYGFVTPAPAGNLVETARAYMGQTARQIGLHRTTLWCATFINRLTAGGTGSDVARSWLARSRIPPQVGAIAVLSRRGGGHVGVVSGFTPSGDPIVISGNHNRRVGEAVYPRARVLAYVSSS